MSKPPRIAIIHIGRTGGMWLRFALQKYFKPQDFCSLQFEEQFPGDLRKLAHFRLFDAHIGYDVASKLNAELITVLRNPYDRIISLYCYLHESKSARELPALVRSMSFDDFLSSDSALARAALVDTQTWQLAFGRTSECRERHRGISADELLHRAMENIRKLSVVGVREDMPTLAQGIEAKLGLKLDLNRPHANATKSRPDFSQLRLETREKIHRHVSIDLALYEHVLKEYVFSSRSGNIGALLSAEISGRKTSADGALTAPPAHAGDLRPLIPARIRKGVSINGLRKLARI